MRSFRYILPVAGAILLLSGAAAPAALADYNDVSVETYSTTEQAEQVNLAVHTSYLSDYYDTILHLQTEDKNVAVASADTEGRVLISAVGTGTTTVSFWYKYGYYDTNDDWTLVTIPVVVSGQSAGVSTGAAVASGLFFPKINVTLKAGETQTLSELTLNGSAVAASELIWLTTQQQVISVGQDTGLITALSPGTAALYALTKDGAYSGCITVTVSKF